MNVFSHWLDSFRQDLRHTFRLMRLSPGFTAIAVISLALGIGANAAIFSIIDALVFKPLPVEEPDRLAELTIGSVNRIFVLPEWRAIERQQDVFSSVAAFNQWWVMTDKLLAMTVGSERHSIAGLYVSGEYFKTLGVPAAVGRVINAADDQPGAPPVCMLSYGLWKKQFGLDPKIVGGIIRLAGKSFQVIGVTPESFFGVEVGDTFDVAVPLAADSVLKPNRMTTGTGIMRLSIVGRLKPGTDITQAAARLSLSTPAIMAAAFPTASVVERDVLLRTRLGAKLMPPGSSNMRGEYNFTLMMMLAMVAVVLIIACTNLANLLLARSSARQREIATRLALGATRGRLMQQLLTESLVLSLLGAAIGLVIAPGAGRLLITAASSARRPSYLDLSLDARVLLFTAAIAIACSVMVGIFPALRAADLAPYAVFHSDSTGKGNRREWVGSGLVVAQIALTMALLVSAGLFVRTIQSLLSLDTGYQPKGLLWSSSDLRLDVSSPGHSLALDQVLAAFRARPGVASVSANTGSANSTIWRSNLVASLPQGSERRGASFFSYITVGAFETLQLPLLAGRDFTSQDGPGSPQVAIMNDAAASTLFPGMNPVGMVYREVDKNGAAQGPPIEIVGVAANEMLTKPGTGPLQTIYRPIAQCTAACNETLYFSVRASSGLTGVAASLSRAAREVNPELAFDFRPATEAIYGMLGDQRLNAEVAGSLGALTLLLAAIGIYGVMSYATARRTKEIGIRMALGASGARVLRMIVGESLTVVVIGIAVGVPLAYSAAQMVRSLLFGVTPADPLSMTAAALVMILVAVAAAWLPARRAAAVDPMVALRCE